MNYDISSLKKICSSLSEYRLVNEIQKQVKNLNKTCIYNIKQAVEEILESTFAPPIQKLLAIRLIKDLIDLDISEFNDLVQNSILIQLEQIAYYKKGPNSKNSKFFFNNNPTPSDAQIGNSFIQLILECIMNWAQIYPQTNFQVTYEKLVSAGVEFPTKIKYFKTEDRMLISTPLSQATVTSNQQNYQKNQLPKSTYVTTSRADLLIQLNREQEFLKHFLGKQQTLMKDDSHILKDTYSNIKYLLDILETQYSIPYQYLVLKDFTIDYPLMDFQTLRSTYLDKLCDKQHHFHNYDFEDQLEEEQEQKPNILHQNLRRNFHKIDPRSDKSRSSYNFDEKSQSHQKSIQQSEFQEKKQLKYSYDPEQLKNHEFQMNKQDFLQKKSNKEPLIEKIQHLQNLRDTERKTMDEYIQEFQLKKEELENELHLVREQNDKITLKLQKVSQENVILSENLEKELNENKELHELIQQKEFEYQEKILQYQTEHSNQIQQLKDIHLKNQEKVINLNQQVLQNEQIIRKHIEDKTKLQKSIELTHSTYVSLSQWNENTKNQTEQLLKLSYENQQLKSMHQNFKDNGQETINQLQNTIKQLQQEKLDLENQLFKKDRELVSIQSKIEDHQHNNKLYMLQLQQVEYLQQENQTLKKSYSEVEKQRIFLLEENIHLKSQLKNRDSDVIVKKKNSPKIFDQSPSILPVTQSKIIKTKSSSNSLVTIRTPSKSPQKIQQSSELSSIQKNLIYPYNDPQAYYKEKNKKINFKGKQIDYFSIVPNKIFLDEDNQQRLKFCCLQKEDELYSNSHLQIKANLNFSVLNGEIVLCLKISYQSKKQQMMLDTQYQFCQVLNVKSTCLLNEKSQLVNPSNQVVHEFQISVFHSFIQSSELILHYNQQDLSVVLPITSFQFLEWVQISCEQFKEKWKINKDKILRSALFNYNQVLIPTPDKIQDLFKKIIFLNPNKQVEYYQLIDEVKFGGLVYSRVLNQFFQIKLSFNPLKQVMIQMSGDQQDELLISLLISTIQFLLI